MKKIIIIAVIFLFPFLDNFSVKAATTVLSGGASLRADYNITKTEADTTDDWNSSANIFLSLMHSRQGEKGGISLGTSANYSYQIKGRESSFSDLRFNFDGWRNRFRSIPPGYSAYYDAGNCPGRRLGGMG